MVQRATRAAGRRRGGVVLPLGMAALTTGQLELLQRARDGVPMWGGIQCAKQSTSGSARLVLLIEQARRFGARSSDRHPRGPVARHAEGLAQRTCEHRAWLASHPVRIARSAPPRSGWKRPRAVHRTWASRATPRAPHGGFVQRSETGAESRPTMHASYWKSRLHTLQEIRPSRRIGARTCWRSVETAGRLERPKEHCRTGTVGFPCRE